MFRFHSSYTIEAVRSFNEKVYFALTSVTAVRYKFCINYESRLRNKRICLYMKQSERII